MDYRKVLAEWESIRATEYWQLWLANIAKRRQQKRNDLETAQIENVPKLQGYIDALNWILGKSEDREPALAEFIVSQLRDESKQGG